MKNWWKKKDRRPQLTNRSPVRRTRLFAQLLEDRTAPAVFSSSGAITIPDSGSASPYPSTISVSGLTGQVVSSVTVTLNGLSHGDPTDLDVLLVAPDGTNIYLMSDNGISDPVSGVNLTFDAAAAGPIPSDDIVSGTYVPSNVNQGDPDTIPGAPAEAPSTSLTAFKGVNPNGTWELRVVDDTAGNSGTIAGGWSMNLVARVNSAPVAVNDSYTATEETTLNVTTAATSVLANDTDADHDALTAQLVSGPNFGTLTFNTDGTFSYVPRPNFDGPVTFTYQASDGISTSNVATVTLNVTNTPDPPTAINDQYTTQSAALTVTAVRGVLANDTDPDGASHQLLAEGFQNLPLVPFPTGVPGGDGTDFTDALPAGWVRDNTTTPAPNPAAPTTKGDQYYGWHVMDVDSWIAEQGNQDRKLFTKGGVGNHGTVVVADGDGYDDYVSLGTTHMNTYLYTPSIPLAGVPANSLTLDFDSSFRPENAPPGHQFGIVEASFDGGTTWTDLQDFNNTNSGGVGGELRINEHLKLNVNNPVGASAALIRFGYLDAGNDWWWAIANVSATVDKTNQTTLTAVTPTNPSHGTLALSPDGSFTYTPTAGFTGTDSFTYKVSDGSTTVGPATVSINVVANSATPVAANDAYQVTQGNTLTVSGIKVGPTELANSGFNGVLANDTDADANAGLTATVVANPTHGTLALNTDGTFTYTPAASFFGTDTFTYKDSDGVHTGNTATATITVVQNNFSAPVAQNDSYSVNNNGTLTAPAATGLVANDTDADNNVLSPVLVIGPNNGALTLNADGSFTYLPRTNFNGTDSFTYKAFDGAFLSNVATVTITVSAINTAPAAIFDSYTINQGASLTTTAVTGVLTNDRDDGPVTQLSFQDFSGLTLQPFNTGVTGGDGTDYTDALPTGWTRTNAATTPAPATPTTAGDEYFGWHAMDIDSWIAQQGNENRNLFTRGGVGSHGTVFVADGDAYDDFVDIDSAHLDTTLVMPAVSVTGLVPNSLTVDFDSSFKPFGDQRGWVDVSYDGGATWTNLTQLNRDNSGDNSSLSRINEHLVLNANNPAGATSATFRFRYKGENDWWWAIDNVRVSGSTAYAGANVTATKATNPAHGTVTLNPNGSFTYTPTAGFSGADSFTYTTGDGVNTSSPATVSITVVPSNTAPTPANDYYSFNQGTALTTTAANGALSNDTDPQNNPRVTLLSEGFDELPLQPWNAGKAPTTRQGNGTDWTNALPTGWTLDNTNTPAAASGTAAGAEFDGWHVMDVDSWIAQQGDQERSRFTIGGAGDNGTVLVADGDTYDDFVNIHGTTPMHTLAITPTVSLAGMAPGSLTLEYDTSYRPEGTQTGAVDVSYDGGATWINLLARNTPNTGGNGSELQINNHVLLSAANPVGATTAEFRFSYTAGNNWWWAIDNVAIKASQAGGTLTATKTSDPAHGTLAFNANGSFTYTATAGFFGTDSFTYTASDGSLTSNPATVVLNVVNAAAPVQIGSIAVNGGAQQRSRVTDITVTFNTVVALPATQASAFQLTRTGPGTPNSNVTLTVDTTLSTPTQTIAKLTFSGALTDSAKSLIDGSYTLTVFGAQVTGAGNVQLDGNADGTAGGDSVTTVKRLYGDATGDGIVNGADITPFIQAFGGTSAMFDFNGDGVVNGTDLSAFIARFGSAV